MSFKGRARGDLDTEFDGDSDFVSNSNGYGNFYGDRYGNRYSNFYNNNGYGSNPYFGYVPQYAAPAAPVAAE